MNDCKVNWLLQHSTRVFYILADAGCNLKDCFFHSDDAGIPFWYFLQNQSFSSFSKENLDFCSVSYLVKIETVTKYTFSLQCIRRSDVLVRFSVFTRREFLADKTLWLQRVVSFWKLDSTREKNKSMALEWLKW